MRMPKTDYYKQAKQQKLIVSIKLERLKEPTIEKLTKKSSVIDEINRPKIMKVAEEEANLLLNLSRVPNDFKINTFSYPPPLPPPPPPPTPPQPPQPVPPPTPPPQPIPEATKLPAKKPKLNDSELVIILDDEDSNINCEEESQMQKDRDIDALETPDKKTTNNTQRNSEVIDISSQTDATITDEDLECINILKKNGITKDILIRLNIIPCEQTLKSKDINNNNKSTTATKENPLITALKSHSDENKAKLLASKFYGFRSLLDIDATHFMNMSAVKHIVTDILKQTHDRYYKDLDAKVESKKAVDTREASCSPISNIGAGLLKQTHDRYYKDHDAQVESKKSVDTREASCSPIGNIGAGLPVNNSVIPGNIIVQSNQDKLFNNFYQNNMNQQIMNRPVQQPQYHNGMINKQNLNDTGQQQWTTNWNPYQQQFHAFVHQPTQQNTGTGYQQPDLNAVPMNHSAENQGQKPKTNRYTRTTLVRDSPYRPRSYPAPLSVDKYREKMQTQIQQGVWMQQQLQMQQQQQQNSQNMWPQFKPPC